eukprot:scaffold302773_cov75-Attheya_sp.AAC.2
MKLHCKLHILGIDGFSLVWDPRRFEQVPKSVERKLGPSAQVKDFEDNVEIHTPTLEHYDDDNDGGMPPVPDRDDIEEEAYDHYIGAEVALPRGDQMLTARVVG